MDVIIPINLVCVLFDPAIPTLSFNLFNCFYTCFCSFFYCFQYNSSYMIALSTLTGPAREVPRFARMCKILSHAPHVPVPRQSDKEAAMRLFDLGRLCW